MKCGEEKPSCAHCVKSGETCDYSIRLNWGGRAQKTRHSFSSATSSSGPSREAFTLAQNALSPIIGKQSPVSTESPALEVSSPYSCATASPVGPRPTSHAGILSSMHHRYSTGSSTVTSRLLSSSSSTSSNWPETRLPHIHQLDTEPYAPMLSPGSATSEVSGSPDMYPALRLPPLSPKTASADFLVQPTIKKPRLSTPTTTSSPDYLATGSGAGVSSPQRLSVNSLLIDSPRESHPSAGIAQSFPSRLLEDGTRIYGYDYGFPDLDIPHNNDSLVMSYKTSGQVRSSRSGTATPISPGNGPMAFESGGYYDKPVQIRISNRFEPLPLSLLQNPMNLLYFHHFLNHTARVLVPVDCQDNPLRSLMPEMAVREPNLLNLLLAYSASHRAQLLRHREPANRIALWMRDSFPSLRKALFSQTPTSDASLVTAVLLCSLKIVSPATFDVPLTWQDYLATARQMIVSRGGLEKVAHGDKYVVFCVKWYCYLETCGGLSGTTEEPLSGEYYAYGDESDAENYYIDCFLGFTNRCMGLLAKVAKLARQCDRERIGTDGLIKEGWRPGDALVGTAHRLRHELERSRDRVNECCVHIRPEQQTKEMQDLHISNKMYHWAGLVHLYRRVLGKAGDDPDVQYCVNSILTEWTGIRKNSTYESCLLLPLFTAGCEVLDQSRRDAIIERLMAVEGWGLPHVSDPRNRAQTGRVAPADILRSFRKRDN